MQDNRVDLRVAKVGLIDPSLKTFRVLNGVNSDSFPVRIWFTRGVGKYERAELLRFALKDFEVDKGDPMQALLITNAQGLASTVDRINQTLAIAAAKAAESQIAAEAEDERIKALIQEVNQGLAPA
jgi:hypothetical protein